MIVYNVTVQVEESILKDWLQWMNTSHIPDVMATGCFKKMRFCKVHPLDNDSQNTYSFQYVCNSQADLDKYNEKYAPLLKKEVVDRYGDKFFAFRTTMEVLGEFKKI
jgi:hypothetical protein